MRPHLLRLKSSLPHRPASSRSHLWRHAGLLALLAATTVCTDRVPSGYGGPPVRVVIRPVFDAAPAGSGAFAYSRVDGSLKGADGSRFDATSPFVGDEAQLRFDVTFSGTVGVFILDVVVFDETGAPVWSKLGHQILVRPGTNDIPQPQLEFVGAGANVASITISPSSVTLSAGGSRQLSVSGVTANNIPVANPPVTWASRAPSIASVSGAGLVTAGNATGTTWVVARALGGLAEDSIPVTVVASTGTTVTGRVVNGSTGAGISGATIVGGTGSTISGSNGTFTLTGVSSGANLSVSASGFVSAQYFNVQLSSASTAIGDIPLAPTPTGTGSISGTVRNAVTLGGVQAQIVARAGVNATTGAIVGSATAAANGTYSMSLSVGTYTLTATASGYGTTSVTATAVANQTRTGNDINIVPVGSGSEVRIVLTWGAQPFDLDSYLTVPGFDTVSYYNREVRNTQGTILASLDVDVTFGFGPETITIPSQIGGTYRYLVHNYSDDCQITVCGATVRVYRGGAQIGEFRPPANQPGRLWLVFDLNGTQLTPLNTILGNLSDAGSTPANAAGGRGKPPRQQ